MITFYLLELYTHFKRKTLIISIKTRSQEDFPLLFLHVSVSQLIQKSKSQVVSTVVLTYLTISAADVLLCCVKVVISFPVFELHAHTGMLIEKIHFTSFQHCNLWKSCSFGHWIFLKKNLINISNFLSLVYLMKVNPEKRFTSS